MSVQIGIIGGGAWGTGLAQMLAANGTPVLLWAREEVVVASINQQRRNALFLPDAPLSPAITATGDLAAMAALPVLLMVTPAQHLGSILGQMAGAGAGDLLLCAKGIEAGSGRLMGDVASQAAPDRAIAVLSGPTFAHEVAAGLPTAVTLACSSEAQWERLSRAIARPAFRPYYSADIAGAEIGGAVKNVLAIACGVVDGLGLGQNARAALISRGYAEMLRFGLAFGGQEQTLAGLCGRGDLVLTCSSTSSRNFSLGRALGEGQSATEVLASRNSVAEGAYTAPVLHKIAQERGIDMPITATVCALLAGRIGGAAAVAQLLARPLRAERSLHVDQAAG